MSVHSISQQGNTGNVMLEHQRLNKNKKPLLDLPCLPIKIAHNLVKMGVKGGPPFLFDEAQVVLAEEWKIQKGGACLLNPTWT